MLCCMVWKECAAGKAVIGLGVCVNRQDKLTQLAFDGFGSHTLKVPDGAADGSSYSSQSLVGQPHTSSPWVHTETTVQLFCCPVSCAHSPRAWQGSQLISKPISVQPWAANNKKWPIIKSQMWIFPNWKRSVSELSSSCHFLQNRALFSPALLQGPSFHSRGERAMSNWSPSYILEPPKGMGNLHKRANVSEERSKPPWARPKCCTSSLLPLPGDQGTHRLCFWYCRQWVVNTAHNRNSAEGSSGSGMMLMGEKNTALDFSYETPQSTLKTLNIGGKKAKLSVWGPRWEIFHPFGRGAALAVKPLSMLQSRCLSVWGARPGVHPSCMSSWRSLEMCHIH